jgi:drug/metabolite transporter (DMT)-like permease
LSVASAPADPGDRRRELIGIFCVVVSALALALKGILAKYIFAEGVDVTTLLAIRYSLALPMIAVVAIYITGSPGALKMAPRDFAMAMLAGALGYYVAGMLDFTALTMIDVSVERVLLFSFPIFVLVLDSIRRRRPPPPRQYVALILAETGIVLVMGVADLDLFLANLEGGLWAIASAFVFAIYYMMNQALGPKLGSARMAMSAIIGATLGTDLHFLITTPFENLATGWTAFGWIAVMALFCSVVPFLLITEGIRRVGASRSALISTVGPVATLVLAWLLLDETMAWEQLTGAALVIASILALEGRLPRWHRSN